MSDLVRVLLVLGLLGYVIGRQLLGEPIRARRLLALPAVLTVMGVADLAHAGRLGPLDVVLLGTTAAVSVGCGVGQGRCLQLAERDGHLWGRLRPRGLWWWAALVGSRLVLTLLAGALGAHVAASGESVLVMFGLNRLAQAAVVGLHALRTGIRFAPEADPRRGAARFLDTSH